MTDNMSKRSWFARRIEHLYEKDQLKGQERLGEAAAIVALLLMTLFFVYHQILQTGFFTSAFGLSEMVLFYANVSTNAIPPNKADKPQPRRSASERNQVGLVPPSD